MDYATRKQLEEIRIIRKKIYYLSSQNQLEEIQRLSPYSDDITSFIKQYNELRLYYTLHLQESYITRPAIIRDIDFNLWVSSKNCSNYALMLKGCAPYEFDAPEGKIELHHIGQDYNAPFAELTLDEHDEHSKLLHSSRQVSWRKNQNLEISFYQERSAYWKRRAKGDYVVSTFQVQAFPAHRFHKQTEYTEELRKTCEVLYGQCEPEDLDYLSDLAKSYAMMQRIGASSLSEFVHNTEVGALREISCTNCGSNDYILHGTYETLNEKVQRYKCQQCGKVFSPFHKSLVSGSSFSFREWIKFIDCLYNGYTIKQIARACDISEKTAHENRMRLFYALKLLNDKVRLQGNVVLDETYLPVSYKGNHSKQDNFVMPRAANERGGENHTKGISSNLTCIVCAVDDNGNSIAKVVGTGASTAGKLKYALKDHLSENVFCLYSDKSKVIKSFAENCGLEIKQAKLLRKGEKTASDVTFNKDTFIVNRYLQIINSYHSRLKRFLNHFSGISTKYLSGYLYLFSWKECNKDRTPEEVYKELLWIMTEPNHYLPIDEIMKKDYLPDAICIDKQYRKLSDRNLERDKEIYRRYAAGETMASIGQDYDMTRQAVSLVVQKLRKMGLAYRTDKDIRKEQENTSGTDDYLKDSQLATLERDYQIYHERMNWHGSADEFNERTAQKHGLSVPTVKNIVAKMKRIQNLKADVFVFENVSYQTIKEVYHAVYADYQSIKKEDVGLSEQAYAQKLAIKYNFSMQNIQRILRIMQNDSDGAYFKKKRKLTKTETYNRDKAVFIDFLRWNGEKRAFCRSAAKKYNLTESTVYKIIRYCLYADPERCKLV